MSMDLSKSQASTSFNYIYLTKRLFPYIKPVMWRIILGFFVAIPLGLLDGVTAFALKPYIDIVVNNQTVTYFGFTLTRDIMAAIIPVGVVAFGAIQGVLKYTNVYLTDWVSQKISNSVKLDLFKKLIVLDSKFYDINSSGLVLTRFLGDPDVASRTFVDNIKSLITALTSSIGLMIVLLTSSWKLALVGIVILGCTVLPVSLIRKRIKQVSLAATVLGGGINTNFNETYHGNKIMKGYNLQESINGKFNSQIRKSFDLNMSLVKRAGWMSPIMYLIASFGVAIVMYFGNGLIIRGELTAGSFASFVTALLLLYKPVKELGSTFTNMQGIFVAASRVFELFDLKPEVKDGVETLEQVVDGVSFENVCFSYDGEREILNNINLSVKKGQTLALVGNSGGGKSTVVNLIPRFYDVTSGEIKIDGKNVKDFTLHSLHNNIAEVFQDNFLFSGTIKDNILMGNPNASEEKLKEAIELAHLNDFLPELENGIDTVIGERGTTLSGGQRQRVAIARAMIKDAPILILDEATSALDNKSEVIVQKALENLMKNKTVFVIAHRLSTIQNADIIAVINEGKVVETGSHNELLERENGAYKRLYDAQFRN